MAGDGIGSFKIIPMCASFTHTEDTTLWAKKIRSLPSGKR